MFAALSSNQAKAFIDLEQTYRAVQEARSKMLAYKGGMHWKTVKGQQYLYRTLDGKGTAKSLGPDSESTRQLHEQFQTQRAALSQRLSALQQRLDEQRRVARALRVGWAPNVLADLCEALDGHGLLGKNLLIIGTNALYAYEALAGVRFQGDVTATRDVDVLFKHRTKLTALARDVGPEGLMGILKRVDKSFEISALQPYRAINAEAYMVDLIRQAPKPPWKTEPHNLGANDAFIAADMAHMDWMLSVPSLRQLVVAHNGTPFDMVVPDPRAFMLFKRWLAKQSDREPVKRHRDLAQANAVEQLIKQHLPHLAMDDAVLKALPKALLSLK